MAFETIIAETSKRGVATITFNRPERGNALSAAMIDEIVSHVRALAEDEKVRVLVLRANGKHFCSGADVSPGKDGPAPMFSLNDLFEAIDQFPKPTIGIVQGGAIGAGACLTTCCDVTYAYPDTFFSIPEVRLGIVPGGVVAALMRAMGTRNMRRYALSGERIMGPEAVRTGFAHELHAAENMDAALDQIVDAMLLGAPNAQKFTKAQIAEYDHETVRDMKAAAAVRKGPHGIKTAEAQEGVAAFKEKRKPSWYVAS
jgi:methylglutaconyl-CoA hydratase